MGLPASVYDKTPTRIAKQKIKLVEMIHVHVEVEKSIKTVVVNNLANPYKIRNC